MKNSKFFLAIVIGVVFAACETKDPVSDTEPTAQYSAQNGSGEKDGYVLVWEDTFDGESLNMDYWNIEVNGNGGGNNELQYYREENVSIQTDEEANRRCMVLTAQREETPYLNKSFTSGRVNTKNKVAYQKGKFEAMIKLPKTYKGLWPAFWAMGNNFDQVNWPACGEFDILEMGHQGGFNLGNGYEENFLNGAFHWGPSWNQHMQHAYSQVYRYSLQDGQYHLFTWIWDDTSGKCYIDLDIYPNADPYFELTIPAPDESDVTNVGNYLQVPYFVILNLAVGGNFPGIDKPDEITALNESNGNKASMWIDYVRIYQKAE